MSIAKEKELLQGRTFQILLIEDDEVDAKWVMRSLEQFDHTKFLVHWSDRLQSGLETLRVKTYDLIISDIKLPDGYAKEVFDALYKTAPQVPIVLLMGTVEEEAIAMEAFKKGVQDCLYKGKISPEGLVRALLYAMERHKLLAMQDAFFNIAAHELRTPLAIIREVLVQTLDGTLNKENYPKFLGMAVEHVDRLHALLNNLLDLAKMNAGRGRLNRENVDIVELTRNVVDEFNMIAREKNVRVSLGSRSKKIKIFVDRDKIVQVLTNLIGNALKFTQQGNIDVVVEEENHGVVCKVTDQGPGIPKEFLPRLFGAFEQFSQDKDARKRGSGLGLSICKGIVHLHGGDIRADSELGKGTTFTFVLPKLKTSDVLCEYLTRCMRHAAQGATGVALIGISAGDGDGVAELKFRQAIVEVGRQYIRRQTDYLLEGDGIVWMVIFDTNKKGAEDIISRIRQQLAKDTDAQAAERLKIILLSYPEDGTTAEELVSKLKFMAQGDDKS